MNAESRLVPPRQPEEIRLILEERARALAQPARDETAEVQLLELLTFCRSGERYGLDMRFVREVQPLSQWTPVPCTPDFIVGALNLRGRVYSITDLSRFFGHPLSPPSENAAVLLVQETEPGARTALAFCLLADGLPVVEHIPQRDLLPPGDVLTEGSLPYVRAVTPEMLIVLDLKRVLSDPAIIVDHGTALF